jgi:hypothetical protein
VIAVSMAASDAGCGGAPPRDGHARHAEIQRHEASLERAIADGTRVQEALAEEVTEERCTALTRAVTEAGEAAERVCEVAREVREADTAVRCERARRRAADATAGRSPCETGDDG